jgi:starch synthase (maltosyl-transferring)
MPNAILEAMAAGKPVVATRSEGVLELLGAAAESQSVSLTDLDQLAGKITAMLAKPELASELGRQNQKRAEEQFSLASMVAGYEALYEC